MRRREAADRHVREDDVEGEAPGAFEAEGREDGHGVGGDGDGPPAHVEEAEVDAWRRAEAHVVAVGAKPRSDVRLEEVAVDLSEAWHTPARGPRVKGVTRRRRRRTGRPPRW